MKGRFAPSPSGRMHLGNVYSAVLSWLSARKQGGSWLLRIEDLDRQRCRQQFAEQIEDDLQWLGLEWDEGGSRGGQAGPYYQSQRSEIYQHAMESLSAQNLIYPCYCSRADIMASSAPHQSDGMVIYNGRCRNLTVEQRRTLGMRRKPAWRIIVPNTESLFSDMHYGPQQLNLATDCGDFIVQRSDGNFAYQLAVVADDALMGVTEVVRGCDLLQSTHQQLYLYNKLGYSAPQFAHLPLLMSVEGCRLAKRDTAAGMDALRAAHTPEQLLGIVGYLARIINKPCAISLSELISEFSWSKIPLANQTVDLHI